MKALFISYNQALTERINKLLDDNGVRGFTRWALTEGRGTETGEPHYGTHTWPGMNTSVLAVTDDARAKLMLEKLRELDAETSMQGCRAFVWDITDQM